MRRFYVEKITGEYAYASPLESAHITKVLRLEKGDEAIIFDGESSCFRAIIDNIEPNNVKFKILNRIEDNSESPLNIKIYQAVIKNDKFDYVVQKCTELGVNQIQPYISKNCVKKPKNPQAFIERENRIALESAKQCGRIIPPQVLSIIDFNDAVKSLPQGLCLFAYENEKHDSIKDILKSKNISDIMPQISAVIGPEGGFDKKEAGMLISAGAVPVSLGKRILRAETAAPAIAAILMYEYEL